MDEQLAIFLGDMRRGSFQDAYILADWLDDHGDHRGPLVRRKVATESLVSPGNARLALRRLFPLWKKDRIMGCDLHCFVEYRLPQTPESGEGDRMWRSFGDRINPGRNYRLFGRLAGVRTGPALVEPRGFPDDAGWMAESRNWLYIYDSEEAAENDDKGCSRAAAEKWMASGSRSRELAGKAQWVEDPDWHSHTWLTPEEWAKAIEVETPEGEPEYFALLAAMRALQKAGYEVRVVFYFDN